MARPRKTIDALSDEFQPPSSDNDESSDDGQLASDDLQSPGLQAPPTERKSTNQHKPQQDDRSEPGETLTDATTENGGLLALKWFSRMLHFASFHTVAGFVSEGENYRELETLPYCFRGAELSAVDGAINLSMPTTSTSTHMSFADKLAALETMGPQKFALEDSKRVSMGLDFSHNHNSELFPDRVVQYNRIALEMNPRQSAILSHLHIRFAAAPQMVAVIPKPALPYLTYSDPMIHHMPIPPRFAGTAMPLSLLGQTQANLRAMYRGEVSSFVVPGSDVKAPAWKANLQQDNLQHLKSSNAAAARAFDFLYDAIRNSPYAKQNSIRLDQAPYQPLGGDAQIHQDGREPEALEFKHGTVSEFTEHIRLSQGRLEKRSRRSPFFPLRTWNFLCLINEKQEYVYCIPASEVQEGWWSSEEFVEMPISRVARFKIICDHDWFAQMHQSILLPYAQSQMPSYAIPPGALSADYAASKVGTNADEFTETRDWRHPSMYPSWKIERWIDWCAWTGYGLFLPCGSHEEVANVVFVAWRWTKAQQSEYWTNRTLPAYLHSGDLGRYTPLLLIRAVNTRDIRNLMLKYTTQPSIPSTISALDVEGPLPCLLYVNTSSPNRPDEEQSGMLIPTEFLDHSKLRETWKVEFNEDITSPRAFLNREKAKAGSAMDNIYDRLIHSTNLQQCLTLPFTEFHVRDGGDFHNAICNFSAAHNNDRKLVDWSSLTSLYAEEDYVVSSQTLFQMFADRWIPATISGRHKHFRWSTDTAEDGDEVEAGGGEEAGRGFAEATSKY